ncbi:hypothetical protein BDD12DRAFT_872046 [Trichophaea hybrida]|nr:hypothetical protein BDD12DRAFT_872046 [Trichophaea hybrida]
MVPKWPLRVNASIFCYPPFSSKITPGHPVRLARRFRYDTPSSSPETAHDGLPPPNMNESLPRVFRESLGSDVFMTKPIVGGPVTPQLATTQWFTSYVSWPGTLFVDKTKYIELLDQSGVYSNMFLRPRRFGKSTFLNMLCAYYDVATAAEFNDIFGGLYISKNPTEFRGRHLVLKLDLSSIETTIDISQSRASFNLYINTTLDAFLYKYRSFLGGYKPGDILYPEDGSGSLRKTLVLVKKFGHSMFVGIDEYDAPANNVVFDGSSPETNLIRIAKVNAIENFFKQNLFAIFKEAVGDGPIGCVSKYLLTGVLPAFRSGMSPLTATNIISGSPKYHGICGFTEKQVETITRAYLDQSSGDLNKDSSSQDQSSLEQDTSGTCWAMKRYYNGYSFTTLGDEERLYNPLLVHYYLSTIKEGEVVANPEESPAVHTVNLLKSIADTGRFSSGDIVDLMMTGSLLATGSVQKEFGFIDVMQQAGKDRNATLSLLFHLGVLTHAGKPGQLRIPNEVMKMNVLNRIHKYICAHEHIQNKIAPANTSLRNGSIEPFAELLQQFLAGRTVRSLRSSNEAVLQGVVEILLDPPRTRVPELYLVMDGKKQKGDGRYAFPDIFVVGDDNSESAVVLELKDIRLSGLWNGAQGGRTKWTNPSYKELEALAEKVSVMNEASMNKMRYMYWSDRDNRYTSTTVGKMRKDALAQVKRYVKVIKKGRAEKFEDSGVRDPRVIVKRTHGTLFSFVLMAVGGRRILYEAGNAEKTEFSYSCTLI